MVIHQGIWSIFIKQLIWLLILRYSGASLKGDKGFKTNWLEFTHRKLDLDFGLESRLRLHFNL